MIVIIYMNPALNRNYTSCKGVNINTLIGIKTFFDMAFYTRCLKTAKS